MSWDDRRFMREGYGVRHKYPKRGRRRNTCIRCGTNRRYRGSNWEWRGPRSMFRTAIWTGLNPPCRKK